MGQNESTGLLPLSPFPALLIHRETEKILVISDLHLGWEVALAEEGVHIPSQTAKLLNRLKQIISSEKPDSILVLGDIRYSIEKIELEEWRDIPDFFEELCKVIPEVKVIPGNHDGNLEALLPKCVEILPQQGKIIGDIGLFHGHMWPDLELLGCSTLVVGHVHPIVVFKDPLGFRITRQVWVKAQCDGRILAKSLFKRHGVKLKKNDDPADVLKADFNIELKVVSLLVMPSFNDFLGGRAINKSIRFRDKEFEDFIGPVLRSGSVNIDKAEIYLLDGTFLGLLGRLRTLS
ncbi:MAG: metallophosphoesterase [Candidatus Bathyarchaeia archaeon]